MTIFTRKMWMNITRLSLSLIILLATIVGSDYMVRGLLTLRHVDKEFLSSAIGAAGNVVGGIIGGVVALLVARYQITQERQREIDEERREFTTLLAMFIDDLEHVCTVLSSLIAAGEIDTDLVKSQLATPTWDRIRPLSIRNLSRDLYLKCSKIEKRLMTIYLLAASNELTVENLDDLRSQCTALIQELRPLVT
ncbi:MAG: hypothetical protein K6T63_12475 [Alicyclobacillus herbarius]|uniref:hypothetical protein n=1 Tax=Alicyclobacillus herbarius TaxID=122960 RepID=UPI002356D7A2|nr:hypothetical protein [Alicyclobacillus herbarius]MCL6633432.1 hypothetical protein [Alicyclobacillus herbarius]